MLFGAPKSRKNVSLFQSRLVMAAQRKSWGFMSHRCDSRLSEVMCSLGLAYLLGWDLALLYLFADACPLCCSCQQGLLLAPTSLFHLVRYIQFMLSKSPKSHHIAAASQHDPGAVPISPSPFPRGANTCTRAVEWAVPLCACGSLFMSLVNYLQVWIILCRRYCVSVGITLRSSFLKLEKSSWWEKGQGSLLFGCVRQRGLVGQHLKQARKVSAVSLHPQSLFFLCLNPCSLPSAAPKTPTPSISPLPWHLSHCLYPTSHCLQQSCLNRSLAMCWCPQWEMGIAGSTISLEPSLHSSQQFQLFVTKSRCLL